MSRHNRRITSALVVLIGLAVLFVVSNMILFHPFEREIDRVSKQLPGYTATLNQYSQQVTEWYNTLPKELQDIP